MKQVKSQIDIQAISELLEDDDLLEMVQAGLLPWVVVDDYKAKIWNQVFDRLVVRDRTLTAVLVSLLFQGVYQIGEV